HTRRDFVPPAGTVEDAIMPDARLFVLLMHRGGKVLAKRVGGSGLADAGYIVLFTLDRHQRRAGYGLGPHRPASVAEFAPGQRMAHKDEIDGLEIDVGRHVDDGEIFIIKFPVLLRRVAVALDHVLEIVAVGIDMAVEIHRHEAGELEEARIDAPQGAWIGPG